MIIQEIGREEVERLLSEQRTARIGFATSEERYLIPLGYVWLEGSLCGVTSRGRKLGLAQTDSRVSFQVDTSAQTGEFIWTSVTGEGTFEVLEDRGSLVRFGRLLNARHRDAPKWLLEFQAEEFAAGRMVAWRLKPTSITGVSVVPPDK